MPCAEVLVFAGNSQCHNERLCLEDEPGVGISGITLGNLEKGDCMSNIVIVYPFDGVVYSDCYRYVDAEMECWR